MEKYVAYYRVSTKQQGKSGLGLAAQREIVGRFIGEDRVLIGEYEEIESGRKDKREILWKAIAHAKREKAKLLIARLDRFSRRVSFIANLMEEGIGLTVAEMPTATDFQLHIFAALAQEERRLISERTKAALYQAKKRGVELGSNGKVLAERNRERSEHKAKELRDYFGEDWQIRPQNWLIDEIKKQNLGRQNETSIYPATLLRHFRRV